MPALSDASIACRAVIERLNEEFRRRIKTQTVLPCAKTVPMLLWAPLGNFHQIRDKTTSSKPNIQNLSMLTIARAD